MKKHSVKYKALLAILVVVVTVVASFLYITEERAVTQRVNYLKVSNDLLVSNQAKAAILPMWNIDYTAIEEILQALSDSPDFISGAFYDDKGFAVAALSVRSVSDLDNVYKISKNIEYLYQNEKLYLGHLEMMVSLDSVNAFANQELRWGITILIAMVFVLMVLIMLVMHYFVTSPLITVSKTFTSIAAGDMDVNIPMQARKDEIGDLVRAAQIFRNKSTEIVEYERNKKEQAQVANQAKNTFLMRISHELRTPLNGILGFADMMKENASNQNKEYIRTICTLGQKMLCQVDDLLDFSGIENNKIRIAPEAVNWANLVERVIMDAKSEIETNNNEFLFISDIDIPREINMDGRRVEQVLRHLLKNAMKFTKDGSVAVNVRQLALNNENIKLRFSVEDNGEGIDREFQTKMFETFTQEDESATRRFGGIGMGLAISIGLVKLMGSKIQVESEKGEGSTFFFDLDLTVACHEVSLTSLQKMKSDVWVWDVSANWRDHVVKQVKRLGLNVRGFDDLNMLRRQLRSVNPNNSIIVLVNPRYSLANVVERLTEIQQDDRCRLIVFQDDNQEERIIEKAKSLPKPFMVTTLHNALYEIFMGVEEGALEGTAAPATKKAISQGMQVLVVEDDLVNQKLATTMLEKMGYNVEVANNGKEAVEVYAKRVFDFILMDMMMPVMDGLQATRAIRRFRGEKGSIPIIAVTANAYEADKDECFKAGMNGYISKPYDLNRLEGEIMRVMHQAMH